MENGGPPLYFWDKGAAQKVLVEDEDERLIFVGNLSSPREEEA